MAPKTIRIACKGSMELELEELIPFQGNLKELSKENYNKLRKSILELGFSAPCFVWKHNRDGQWMILDSHQRVIVLTEMKRAEGYKIPKLPCVEIEADSEHEAKKKLLAITSNYGQITGEGLYEFASLNNIDLPTIEDFRFPEINMDAWKAEFFDGEILPGTEDEQGKLDEKKKTQCPECGHEF
jgi:hypothetical protein